MNPINNPFAPGAGTQPPALVGREEILSQGDTLFERILAGRSEKSLMLTGLRGVGKTVLLNRLEDMAQTKRFLTIFHEAEEGVRMGGFLVQGLRKILLRLDIHASAKEKVKKALIALRNFAGTLSLKIGDLGLSAEPVHGFSDSGELDQDLTDLLLLVADAAKEQKRAVAIFIDEIQYFEKKEFGALIMAFHRIQQRALPIVLVGAGLPQLPALAGELKSYAERLFAFPRIGALSEADTKKAVVQPLEREGVKIETAAVKRIAQKTRGYPYFIQEWGSQVWLAAPEKAEISLEIVDRATSDVIRRLDENFFHVRYDRLTPGEKRFLRHMAHVANDAPVKMDALSRSMGKKASTLAQVRRSLEQKGAIYAPHYGVFDFTVPLFGEFMKRAMPLSSRARENS